MYRIFIVEDDRALVSSPALEAKALKRAKGILSREVKRTAGRRARSSAAFWGR